MRQPIVRRGGGGGGGRGRGQVTWETFREKGKVACNRGGANIIYYATLVLYLFHADRRR